MASKQEKKKKIKEMHILLQIIFMITEANSTFQAVKYAMHEVLLRLVVLTPVVFLTISKTGPSDVRTPYLCPIAKQKYT